MPKPGKTGAIGAGDFVDFNIPLCSYRPLSQTYEIKPFFGDTSDSVIRRWPGISGDSADTSKASQLSLIEMKQMKVNGACHCGRITYEAEVEPERSGICHCTDCQVLTGSAFRVTVPTVAGTFRLLTGTPTAYLKTTADSGGRRRHAFCPNCGTPVYAGADEDNPATRNLRVGCLAQREHLAPKRRIWCKSAVSWSQDIGSLPGIPKQ